ncbi:MAG: tRNA (adenosine(37)-N6)-threonylcarbamoyltransferase complex dimerization subunit type 1 TsaB [Anaerolineae bacterium]
MILAIDTATEFAGLALYNADTVWAEEIWHAAQNHTAELAPRLRRMLQQANLSPAELEGIAVSIGPGSYTGLRIGLALAKGLALPHRLPLVGVPTLEITAYPHRNQTLPVVALARAGRGRILAARYHSDGNGWQETAPPHLLALAELAPQITEPALVAGEITAQEAADLCQQTQNRAQVAGPIHRVRRPGVLAELGALKLTRGEPDDPAGLTPLYLKEP